MTRNIYYQNVRGLRTKLNDFRTSASTISHDIIILSETWLDPSIYSAELGLPNHLIYRVDRSPNTSSKSRGGGVLIAVNKKISSKLLKNKNCDVEQIYVMLNDKTKKTIIGCVYIPPNSNITKYKSHCEDVELLKSNHPNHHIILCGDYNLPNCKFNDLDYLPVTACEREILDMSIYLGLFQCNNVSNCSNRLLDLIFSTEKDIKVFESVEFFDPIDKHHPPLTILEPNTIECVPTIKKYSRNFINANYHDINHALNCVDWSLLNEGDLNYSVELFYTQLNNIISDTIPLTHLKIPKYPIWFSKELVQLIAIKKEIHKKFKENRSLSNYMAFNNIRRDCKKITKSCYNNYINSVENNIIHDVKYFWKYTKSMKKNSVGISGNMRYGQHSSSKIKEIVNMFADFFKDVYEPVIPDDLIPHFNSDINLDLSQIHIDIKDIIGGIKSLEPKTSSGPDKIPPIFLKNCAHSLSVPLNILFNKSLSTGSFPQIWKLSYLTPVFKSGDQSFVENYRPICILSSIPKLFEKLILNKISFILNSCITTCQHGFVSGRSTLTNLTLYENFISNALSHNQQVDSIYTDFSKAFDKVCHKILINKLSKLGIKGNLLSWFKSYLVMRQLTVCLFDNLSYTFEATSGVPQGSHLGPILFNLFINDVPNIFTHVLILMFADDLKLYKIIHNIEDCLSLQSNLNCFSDWCLQNKLTLNVNKCQVMRFHRKRNPLLFTYFLNNHTLSAVVEIRDLGITFDTKLTFIKHINNITSKAMQMLGFILRISKDFKNLKTVKLLYISLVRSQLEFNSTIWNPYYSVHENSLERVQHKFLRHINFKLGIFIENINYFSLLQLLGLDTLKERRICSDLFYLFKIVNNLLNSPELLSLICFHVPSRSVRHKLPYHCKNAGSNAELYSIINRLHMLGNKYVVDDVINIERLSTYKHYIIKAVCQRFLVGI